MKPTGRKAAATGEAARAAPARTLPVLLIVASAVILVLAAYIWFVSVGTWTQWPLGGSYYDQLANAFRRGHLWLEHTPSRELLALQNPYDPGARAGVSFISDASLYNGRYYLYFGPMPALLVAGLKYIFPVLVGDQYLVFAFVAGTFLVLVTFILRIWRQFFPGFSAWLVAAVVVGAGLITPFTWILGSNASVHDAAISAGQFFFLAGLYATWAAVDQSPVSWRAAALAGILWAAALASRITLVVPILVVLLVLCVWLLRRRGDSPAKHVGTPIAAFVLPVLLGFGVLGWYNWARFGSVLETGISYQLALLYLQAHQGELFNIRYVTQNLYNYLLMRPKIRYNFPYIWPQMGIRHPIVPGLELPSLYFAENITGLVFTSPFLLCGFGLLFGLPPGHEGGRRSERALRSLPWLQATLGAATLSGFAMFLVFFWGSERYLMDFLPAGLLLGVIGFWDGVNAIKSQSPGRFAFALLGLGLLLLSVIVSSLLAIALNASAFRQIDPVLWQQLNNVFRP